MRRNLSLLVGLITLSASLSLFAAVPLTVTILADSGPGSLRDQVAAAAPGDTIDFDAALDGKTILLTSGSIDVDKELTIDASALSNRILISGNNSSRIFTVLNPGELSLESLILKDGNDPIGGAIRNSSTLNINRCSLHNNSSTTGGALNSSGTLTLTNSTLYSNSATTAGALYAGGSTTSVKNSTFSLNSATGDGGAIFVSTFGRATLLNCTVSDNTAAGNGGGIRVESAFFAEGTLTLLNTIVAGNNTNVIGPINQDTFSIISGDPLLMPFANYGGPTQTMPPLVQSPAVDGGGAFAGLLPTDQQGNPRIVNGTPDIGAVELQPPHFFPADGAIDLSPQPELIWFWELDADSYEIFAGTSPGVLTSVLTTTDTRTSNLFFTPATTHFWRVEATTGASIVSSAERSFTTRPVLLVTTDADENDPGLGLGAGDSLREVIAAAASQPGKDVIEFDAGLNGKTLVLSISSLNVTGGLLLDASSLSGGLTISGGNALPMFLVSSGGDLTLRSISFINGFSAGSGGAITNLGNLEIQNCSFANCSSQSSGGALHSSGGTLVISSSTFVGNSAAQNSFNHGGAIRSNGGGATLQITNSTLTGNTAGAGGAISTTGAMVALNNTIVGNSAAFDGGGVWLTGTNEATNTIIANNTAPMDPDLKGTLTTSNNNFLGGDPLLSPLAFNGGKTQTILPQPHSPVIDAGINSGGLPSTDQRGQPRVQHLLVDIGAVEIAAPLFLPADTATGLSAEPVLAWYFDPGADSFEVFLGPNPGALSSIGTTANRSITAAALTTGETYFWRVDATTGGSTVSSPVLSFTVRSSPVVTTALDENDGALGLGAGDSLREALEAANTLVGVDTITFAPGLDGQTITLTTGALSATTELSIDASMLPNGLTIDGDTTDRILHISAAAICSLDSLHLTRANASGGGGAVLNEGSLTVLRSTISQCFSLMSGGAIENSGSLTIENSTLAENVGLFDGGALSNLGTATIRHATLAANEAFFGSGGGVSNQGTLTLENSVVAANTANSDDNLSGSAPTQLGNNLTSGNPRIAPLGDYASPTASMPPLPGSPLIEGAILLGSTPPTDQHGNSRPSGPLPDLGAIEAAAVAPLLAPLPDTDGDGIPDILEGFSGPYPQFTVGVDDSLLDTDGDRIPDAQELRDMSDPLDNSDSFRLLNIAPAPGFDAQTNPLVEVTVKTFPGFSYEFETDATLLNFQSVPGSQFAATDFQSTFQILLGPGGDFIRARRN